MYVRISKVNYFFASLQFEIFSLTFTQLKRRFSSTFCCCYSSSLFQLMWNLIAKSILVICHFFCVAIFFLPFSLTRKMLPCSSSTIFSIRIRDEEENENSIKEIRIVPFSQFIHTHRQTRERDWGVERMTSNFYFWGYVQILRNYERRCIRLNTHGIEFIWTVLHAAHNMRRTIILCIS